MAPNPSSKAPEATQALIDHWEAILKEQGLSDVLRSGNPYRSGTVSHDVLTWKAKTEYYAALGRALHDNLILDAAQALIMRMRGNGRSTRDIIKALLFQYGKWSEAQVRKVIRHYEHEWKIRSWTLKERGIKL